MKRLLFILILCYAVGFAGATNILSLTSTQGHPGDTVEIHLSLNNSDAVVAFQTEIPLNSSLSFVPNSCILSSRCSQHQLTASVVNGSLRILIYNFSLTSFSGNIGDLCTFKLVLGREPATYSLTPTNTILSSAAGQALPLDGTTNGSVTLLSAKLQLHGNNINYGHVPIRSTYNGGMLVSNVGNEPLVISALNFTDNTFSSTSVPLTIAAGSSATLNVSFAPVIPGPVNERVTIVSNSATGNQQLLLLADPFSVNEIHVVNVSGNSDSIVEVSLSLNNMDSIVGLQCQFRLPGALEYIPGSFSLNNGRKRDHTAISGLHGDTLILAAFSFNNKAFLGGDGIVASFRLKLAGRSGSYTLHHISPILSDANGTNVLSASYDGYVTVRSPRINCSNSLTFGHTAVTDTVIKTLTVNNYGNAPLTLQQASFMQQGYYVQETFPIVVANYQSTVLHVCYTGTQDGNFSTTMQLYSNDPENGLKSINLSGSRYEPNGIALTAPSGTSFHDNVVLDVDLTNYSAIAGVQFDLQYPNADYSVTPFDFILSERSVNHNITAVALNDSVYRVLIFSMQNTPLANNSGAIVRVSLHPKSHTSAGTFPVGLSNVVLSDQSGVNRLTEEVLPTFFSTIVPTYSVVVNQTHGGTVTGDMGIFTENTTISLTATPNYCSSFVQWQDGNTDNPRTFILTQDTVFTPEFNSFIIYNNLTVQACESYTWNTGNQQTYSQSGVYIYSRTDTNGCMKVDTLNLTVNHSNTGIDEQTACDSYTWIDGVTYTNSTNTPIFTLTNVAGCDSVVTLHLTVNYADTVRFNETTCQGEAYEGYGFNIPADSTTYAHVIVETQNFASLQTGCDSCTVLTLTVLPHSYTSVMTESCDSYSWNDSIYTTSGDYVQHFQAANGCDSVVTLHLTIYNPVHTATTEVACESFTWASPAGNGQTYTQSGNYLYSHTDGNGCTQVDTLHLTINHAYSFTENITMSDDTAFVWHGQLIDCSTLAPGGYTYFDSLQTVYGCDSLFKLILTVTHYDINTISGIAVAQNVENDVSISISMNNETDITAVQFDIQIPEEYSVQSSDFIKGQRCQNHTLSVSNIGNNVWRVMLFSMQNQLVAGNNGTVLIIDIHPYTNTQAGSYNAAISNVILSDLLGHNCISSYSSNISFNTICPAISTSETRTICDSELPFYWNDHWYYEAGVYADTMLTSHGCDSIITLHLTVNYGTHNVESEIACESFTWHETTYSTSGTYTYEYNNASSCPSVDTLHLTIHQSASTSFSAESEDSYTWNGETYYQSGDYVQHFTTINGCDSTVTLHLTITVNVNEYDQSRLFSVFPNPSTDIVNIQAKELGWGITEIRVFDTNGKFIFKQNENNVNSTQIDLSPFAQGIYYIELTNDRCEHIVVKAVKR